MSTTVWVEAPPPVDLAGRRGGSHHCLGPPSTSETEAPGYLDRTPQAFLAEFEPGFTLGVHFHRVHQFQWFVRGSGTFGAHPVGAGTLHFADRLTPYGPLVTGETGAAFLTLRSISDTGAHFMPGSRDELRGRRRPADAADPSARRNLTWELGSAAVARGRWTHLCDEPDGLRVSALTLGAGESLPDIVAGGTGAYLAVVKGCIDGGVRTCGFSWLDAGERSPSVVAGADGTVVGLFQLPSAPWLTSGPSHG